MLWVYFLLLLYLIYLIIVLSMFNFVYLLCTLCVHWVAIFFILYIYVYTYNSELYADKLVFIIILLKRSISYHPASNIFCTLDWSSHFYRFPMLCRCTLLQWQCFSQHLSCTIYLSSIYHPPSSWAQCK